MDDEERLKLGKGTTMDKRRIRRLPPVVKTTGWIGLLLLVLVLVWWLRPNPPAGPLPASPPLYLDTMGAKEDGTVVYSNDFESRPGFAFPEWSSSEITYTNRFGLGLSGTRGSQAVTNVESLNGKRRFLGEFGGPRLDPTARTRVRQAIRLVLKDLAPHTKVTVSLDLLILKSWDGSSPQYGPDRWSARVGEGPVLLDTTFSNNPKIGTDKSLQDFPRPGSRPQEGASAVRTLGYRFFGDSVYDLSFTFPHTAGTLSLEFASDLFEGKGTRDESWGLDDVIIRIDGDRDSRATGEGRRLPGNVIRPGGK